MTGRFERMRRFWYHQPEILFNMVHQLKYRETVFIRDGCVHRCIKANAVKFLEMNFERYHFHDEPFNVYSSLAWFPDMPMFSFNRQEKREQMDEFNQNFEGYINKYDFLMDIDNPKITQALKTFRLAKRKFDKAKVPYWCLFSGTKGFHIRVDWDDFPKRLKEMPAQELADLFKKFSENFSAINGLDDIDYSIYDLRRISKTPYSIVYPYYFIAMPLTGRQIADFDLKEMSLPYNMTRVHNFNRRGVLKRDGTAEGFDKLIKKYTEV